ncbi:MAG: CoA transferase [Pseudomonadota bacterium]
MYDFLSGLRIVECSAFVAAPLCGNVFGQYGATVVRIDPLQGGIDRHRWPVSAEGGSLYWAGLNNTKKSVCLDLSRPEGRELALRLITAPGPGSGIFSTNLRGSWLRYEALAAHRPDLVMLSILGHADGTSAVDYTVNAETGIPGLTGEAGDAAPVNHSLPAWDIATGLQGAFALLAALRRRDATGQGSHIQLSLADVAYSSLAQLGYTSEVQVNGQARPALGNYLYGAFGKDFATRDGRRVMVVAISPNQWTSLLEATGLGNAFADAAQAHGLDFRQEGDRYLGREAIAAILAGWIGARTFDAVAQAFDGKGVCWSAYRSLEQAVAEDRRFAPVGDGLFETVTHPGVGRYATPGAAARIAGAARAPVPAAPQLGRDTDQVLREMLGMDDGAIAALRRRGLVGPPP